MMSPDILAMPAAGQDLYGKTAGDMVSDMRVYEDGSAAGTFHYVTGYTGFNESVKKEQEGYYFPFELKKTGEKMTFLKNGNPVKQDIPWEEKNVLRVTKGDTFTIQVDSEDVCTLNFKKAAFDPKE